MQNFRILRNPFFRMSYSIKKEEELTKTSGLPKLLHWLRTLRLDLKITSRWGEGSANLLLQKITRMFILMQNFTALGESIHIQYRTKERDIERERKSTLIVDTEFCMPRLGLEHALHSDQIYLSFFVDISVLV